MKIKITLAVLLLQLFICCGAQAQSPLQLPALNAQPTGLSLQGKFIWFDLATPNIAGQKEFYSSVFGWTYESVANTADAYALIKNNGQVIGGLFSHEPPGGEQDGATWIALMSHPDPDLAARTVKTKGGKVNLQPAEVPNRGRHALFEDPAGALFGVLASSSGDPEDREMEIGEFLWVDLFTRDLDGMGEFYSSLAPYTQERNEIANGVERVFFSAHDMPRAGLVEVDEEANRSSWVPYVRVEDVEATLEKVEEGGGFAIVSPDPELLDGNVAVFVDPNGGVMGIVKWEYEEAPE